MGIEIFEIVIFLRNGGVRMADSSSRGKSFLLKELGTLQSENIIDAVTAERIAEYYSADTSGFGCRAARSYFLLALAVVGALLIGGGVILLFAYNWNMLPKYGRVAASFIPWFISVLLGVYVIVWHKDARYREFAAVFSSSSYAVLIALISQIYNINGSLDSFAKLLLFFSLPLVYIFRSRILSALYCAGLFALNTNVYFETNSDYILKFVYLAAIVPFFYRELFSQKGSGGMLFCTATFIPITAFMLMGDFFINIPMAASLLIAAGMAFGKRSVPRVCSVWTGVGWIIFTVYLLFLSYSAGTCDLSGAGSFSQGAFLAHYFWLIPFVLLIPAAIRLGGLSRKLLVLGLPFLTVMSRFSVIPVYLRFPIVNFYFIFVGFYNLTDGLKSRNMSVINMGVIQLILFISAKFYDSDMSILWKGTAFIAAGVLLVMLNIFLSRMFAKEDAKGSAGRVGS